MHPHIEPSGLRFGIGVFGRFAERLNELELMVRDSLADDLVHDLGDFRHLLLQRQAKEMRRIDVQRLGERRHLVERVEASYPSPTSCHRIENDCSSTDFDQRSSVVRMNNADHSVERMCSKSVDLA
jgi:hypothetical protein